MVHGVSMETEFPYNGKAAACPADKTDHATVMSVSSIQEDGSDLHSASSPNFAGVALGIMGWKKFAENKEEAMVRGLVMLGPVAAAIACGPTWNLYSSGIIMIADESLRSDWVVNHAVVVYGYG